MGKKRDAYELLGKITGWYLGDPSVFPKRLREDIKLWVDAYEMPAETELHHPYCDCDYCTITYNIHEDRKELAQKVTEEIMKHLGR
jgi:hypothetical protein